MLIKEKLSLPVVFTVLLTIMPLSFYFVNGKQDFYWIILAAANFAAFSMMSFYFRKRNIKYKSDEKGSSSI